MSPIELILHAGSALAHRDLVRAASSALDTDGPLDVAAGASVSLQARATAGGSSRVAAGGVLSASRPGGQILPISSSKPFFELNDIAVPWYLADARELARYTKGGASPGSTRLVSIWIEGVRDGSITVDDLAGIAASAAVMINGTGAMEDIVVVVRQRDDVVSSGVLQAATARGILAVRVDSEGRATAVSGQPVLDFDLLQARSQVLGLPEQEVSVLVQMVVPARGDDIGSDEVVEYTRRMLVPDLAVHKGILRKRPGRTRYSNIKLNIASSDPG